MKEVRTEKQARYGSPGRAAMLYL
eukprot:COSAG02_NODE_36254_length_457_cov_0.720670_1_plen_23_part_10